MIEKGPQHCLIAAANTPKIQFTAAAPPSELFFKILLLFLLHEIPQTKVNEHDLPYAATVPKFRGQR